MSEPERSLWRAVLAQAHEDAEMAATGNENGSEPFECSRARQYLRADNPEESEYLKLVCECAEIPADRVISWARRRYRAEQTVDHCVECASGTGALAAE